MAQFVNPDQVFFDDRTGRPVANGTAYFGQPNQDPETNPKQPYSDVGLTTPINATQVLTAAGKPEQRLYLGGSYSLRVRDSFGAEVSTDLFVEGIGGSSGSAVTANDYDDLALILADNEVAVGTVITVLSPDGYVYEKKQGIAFDDGIRIIAQNRATTTAAQYYGELTGAGADLPSYGTNGDFYTDDSGQDDSYILKRLPGRTPSTSLQDGMSFRFFAANKSTGTTTATADISDALGQPQGTTIKSIYYLGEFDLGDTQIDRRDPVELIYYEYFDYLLLRNDASYNRYDNSISGLGATIVQDALDELADLVGQDLTLPEDSVDTAQIVAAAIGREELATATGSASGSVAESASSSLSLNPYSFFPDIASDTGVLLKGAGTTATPDSPTIGFFGQSAGSYSIAYRYIITA